MHIIILPGNGAGDVFHANWYGWLYKKLNDMDGITCSLKNMPDPVGAKESVWLPFLKKELNATKDSVIVGHSSGAAAAMRYAENNQVKGIVLVGAYVSDLGDKLERESGYFNRPWEWEKIKGNCEWICQFASEDDPFLPWEEQKEISSKLNVDLHAYNDKGHFMSLQFADLLNTLNKHF